MNGKQNKMISNPELAAILRKTLPVEECEAALKYLNSLNLSCRDSLAMTGIPCPRHAHDGRDY